MKINVKHFIAFWIFIFCNTTIFADVLKPALAETTIYDEKVEIHLSLSLEAALSGISTNLKNTQNAPNEEKYQELRVLQPAQLLEVFEANKDNFLSNIAFYIDGKSHTPILETIHIDEVGYTKRSRKSELVLFINAPVHASIGWEYSEQYGDSAFRFRFYQEDVYNWSAWQIVSDKLSIDITDIKPLSAFENAAKFAYTGFYHVIPLGLDHILFIIVMTLSAINFLKTVVLVSSFTLAHTITLALATFGVVVVNTTLVEILIAASIGLVALENLFAKYNHKRQIIVVFIFGLLHGLGFATMLKSFIEDNFVSSLIGFNIGVEIAQIIIVALVLLVLFIVKSIGIRQKIITLPTNIAVLIVALIMVFERI